MPADDHVLHVHDVHRSYGRRSVLRGASLDLSAGRLVGIVGENGAGKSTLLRILVGDLTMDRGTVQHKGRVGYCPQKTVLHETFTVDQHLRYFQVAYGLDRLDRALELLETLNFAEYRYQRVQTLSGGTRQKLNLTLALMHNPRLLLLDEPYQGFDWETYLRFWDLAQGLRESGCSVLVVSHLAYDAERLDAVYHLADGTLHNAERLTSGCGAVA